MVKDLVTTKHNDPVLYDRMRMAIAACCSIDDCKEIANQAAAIAAYFKQIKDDESVKKFIQVKLRAWRRIGELLLACGVDKSKCVYKGSHHPGSTNYAEYARQIRKAFKNQKDIALLNDAEIKQAVSCAEVPLGFFEKNVTNCTSVVGLINEYVSFQRREWQLSPEGQAELKRIKQYEEKYKREHTEKLRAERAEAESKRRTEQAEAESIKALKYARAQAFNEVGITLDRHDREEMHEIVFLLKKTIHEVLRKAAFDNRTTMQAILRSGLMMWFIAHGYSVPADDMKLPIRDGTHDGKREPR